MSNTLLTPSIIAKEALVSLESSLVMGSLVHRDFADELHQVGDEITVRKPATFESKQWNGSTIDIQNVQESGIAVKLDKLLDVSFAVSSKELTMGIEDFSTQFLKPAMEAHALAIDKLLCDLYVDVYNNYVSATPGIAEMANIARDMNIARIPASNRALVSDPVTFAKLCATEAFVAAEKCGSTEALRNAGLGRLMGVDTYMDQNITTKVSGVTLPAPDSKLKCTASAGASSITVTLSGTTGSLGKGDIIEFTVSGKKHSHVVVTGATFASGSATVSIAPAIATAISNQDVSIISSGINNLAFHKNAFCLVTRPLSLALGTKSEVVTYNDLTARAVYGYNMATKTDTVSIDILLGVKTLDPNLAIRYIDK